MDKPAPIGAIVNDWTQSGRHFQIERLDPPVQKGRHLRFFRLWENGEPSGGGQWHYTVDGAKERADYVTQSFDGARIRKLEEQVATLRRDLAMARAMIPLPPEGTLL